MKPDLDSMKGIRAVAGEVYPDHSPFSLKDLFRRHDFRISEPRSLRRLLRRWSPDWQAMVFRTLWQNTYLMRIYGKVVVPAPPPLGYAEEEVPIVEKPDTLERATEWGEALAGSDFDAAFLCEVWTPDVKLLLLGPVLGNLQGIAEGPQGDGTSTVVIGPGVLPIVNKIGSGLIDLVFSRSIQETQFLTFSKQGDLSRDADALSKKSVLLIRVDVGMGVLDLYSTHLFAGGGIGGEPSASEKLEVQTTQLDELAGFIELTHRKENVALVMGDFNLDGRSAAAYNTLTRKLTGLGLFDVWPFQFPASTAPTPGPTDLGDKPLGGPPWMCHIVDDGHLCGEDEAAFPTRTGVARIDYLFCEKATDSHALNVVVGKVRRIVFERIQEGFPYLSDHLGLAFNLICSAR